MPGDRFPKLTLKKTVCVQRNPRVIPAGMAERESAWGPGGCIRGMLGNKYRYPLAVDQREVQQKQEESYENSRGSKTARHRAGSAIPAYLGCAFHRACNWHRT